MNSDGNGSATCMTSHVLSSLFQRTLASTQVQISRKQLQENCHKLRTILGDDDEKRKFHEFAKLQGGKDALLVAWETLSSFETIDTRKVESTLLQSIAQVWFRLSLPLRIRRRVRKFLRTGT